MRLASRRRGRGAVSSWWRVLAVLVLCLTVVSIYFASQDVQRVVQPSLGDAVMSLPGSAPLVGQLVHWVFTTDCSAYMYNQGNLLLSSAFHVNQPGEFTWIMSGCTTQKQKDIVSLSAKDAHPGARVFFAEDVPLIHPTTGKTYAPFQASNRPQALQQWWLSESHTIPSGAAVGILDPDEIFMRPVHLVPSPQSTAAGGPWETHEAIPKRGSGARYGIGCVAQRLGEEGLRTVCSNNPAGCLKYVAGGKDCWENFSHGPPWIFHRDDAAEIFPVFVDYAIKTHDLWPEMLAEQASFQLVQMSIGAQNRLDAFWFLSETEDEGQPWLAVARLKYDPCRERLPPMADAALPPLWHACSTWEIPHLKNQGFRLHKDHIHKDLLECSAPLLHYPPQDALERYKQAAFSEAYKWKDWFDWRDTWAVCTYTNLVNFYAGLWKRQHCATPNLEPSFAYPDSSQSFLNPNSELQRLFRRGGWHDVDYNIGRTVTPAPTPESTPPPTPAPTQGSMSQSVHWVLTADCSAYMYNLVNLLLTSAYHVGQPGEFTWIVSGCSTLAQKTKLEESIKYSHPRAHLFYARDEPLTHPSTGKRYAPFQASNRPPALRQWFQEVSPTEEAIGIIDPDEMFMRPVHLVQEPTDTSGGGPWQTHAVFRHHGSGARYALGCTAQRFTPADLHEICSDNPTGCMKYQQGGNDCEDNFASGPPWILHRDDAALLLPKFSDYSIRTHDKWPDMLAEQGSYGLVQMAIGMDNHLDRFWFLSAVSDLEQPWLAASRTKYDPCRERAPPDINLAMPPLWHGCSTYEIPHLKGKGFRLHKDHIHKDILECSAPLLHYPPRDALEKYDPQSEEWREAWSVCTFTNLVNFHASVFKKKSCNQPNLEPSFKYPTGSQGFANAESELKKIFRKGGWSDVDYKLGRTNISAEEENKTAIVEERKETTVAAPPEPELVGQKVHWVFTTDCSAYMFNQGNLLLTSAFHVKQPGAFTWIIYGCTRKEQKGKLQAVRHAHPRANIFYAKDGDLTHPSTGKTYPHFQASNRPQALRQWWQEAPAREDAIGILDPDEMFMRPVHLVSEPRTARGLRGPWQTYAVAPRRGSGAMYGIGCVPHRIGAPGLRKICNENPRACLAWLENEGKCSQEYSSGPPWIMHRDDADKLLPKFIDFAIKTHELWPDMLAEQGSYGLAQMSIGMGNHLDSFWFLSSPWDGHQPWKETSLVDYDPCKSREPPDPNLPLPPLWHACSTFEIPHLENQGFRIHKDHIHKDLLDCSAPLLHYPPRDALERYNRNHESLDWRHTWSVCAYTNLVNFHAAAWKKRECKDPNLEPSFKYPPHSQDFLDPNSELKKIFRKGGWTDIDYNPG